MRESPADTRRRACALNPDVPAAFVSADHFLLVTAKTLSKMPIELDVSQSTNCCSPNGTIFTVLMGRAVVEKGQHDSFTTPFVVQSTDDTTLLSPCVAHLSTNSLPSENQDGLQQTLPATSRRTRSRATVKIPGISHANHSKIGLHKIGTHGLTIHTMVHLAEPDLELVEETSSCASEEMFHGLTPTKNLLLRCKTTSSRGSKRIVM